MENEALHLASTLSPECQEKSKSNNPRTILFSVFSEILYYLQITTKNLTPPVDETLPKKIQVEQLAQFFGLRIRTVHLNENWATQDSGPLLVFTINENIPYALIPKNGRYPSKTDNLQFESNAFTFYKSFPDIVLSWKDLLVFSKTNLKTDIVRILQLQVCIGLIGLLTPIATGIMLDNVIPFADFSLLTQLLIALTVSVMASSTLGLCQSLGLMRVRFQANIITQAAVWDRILRLPISFFKRFNAGDLASRARGIDLIQQQITQTFLFATINGVFSILTIALLVYYDIWLALSACILAFIAVVINLIFNYLILIYQRPLLSIQGELSGFLFQVLSSISKLRVSNSEHRVFLEWCKKFSEKNKLFLKSKTLINNYNVFHKFFLVLSTIILFALVVWRGKSLSFGSFVAFYAAYGQFLTAVLSMSFAITKSLRILPLYERITPIITTLPENSKPEQDPVILKGYIEIREVSFRYFSEEPLLFDNLSLTVKPGQFIALTGPSGSGKSTLFRLLLGFETPEKGNIFYDGQNLAGCNIRHLRQQLGVVLQHSSLMPGSIYDNIVGFNSDITIDDAWETAHLVGIANDIQVMPMKMNTLVLENGRTLSAGQRQRIMIARAIIRKPKILLLDEATSALDNTTQRLISDNLTQLNITRIISAHRLSTIMQADLIYVFNNGKIVESGTYKELSSTHGLFFDLIQRQKI